MAQVSGTQRLKVWFFTATAVGFKMGSRFLNNDRPEEQTFRDLLESVAAKTEISDQAQKDDSSSNLGDKAGLVILATNAQAKANTIPSGGKALVPTTDQLPESASSTQSMTINGSSFTDDNVIDISVDGATASRNKFLFKLKDSFVTYLTALFTTLKSTIDTTTSNLSSLQTSYSAFVTSTNAAIANLTTQINSLSAGVLPIGTHVFIHDTSLVVTMGNSVYLNEDGRAVSRTTYAALFALIGTTYGVGDGSTTFNLPNATDCFMKGTPASVGAIGGSNAKTISASNLPDHNHSMSAANGASFNIIGGGHEHSVGFAVRGDAAGGSAKTYSVLTLNETSKSTSGGGSHTHVPSEFSGATGINTGVKSPLDITPKFIGSPLFIKAL